MYKFSWGWTLGCSKHVEDSIIKFKHKYKKCAVCWFLIHTSDTSSPSGSLLSTATAVLVLRMCLKPRDLEHYVVVWVWISWHTQYTRTRTIILDDLCAQLCVHPTLLLRVGTMSAAGRLLAAAPKSRHTLWLFCSFHFTCNSVSLFIRLRCMDDKLS